MVEIDLALRLLAAGIDYATKLKALVTLTPEQLAELNQLIADAEAKRADLEQQWAGLAPGATPPTL